ncbi:hypothetical protein HYPSUDRAFT_209256 [Hypholoma sublateritium FD-334 SS-4]|uniref:Uncharacterized protein n=1 Tax=Hypholoma sublateritium (strain FD-334 SS-4) TaxID=945553 RepID=A0A0D2LSI2_HYPSF|nr:hypothetical protein HYPSUDRAFT_209256 [Hypholoma sublateritium FD-334 SS-4]
MSRTSFGKIVGHTVELFMLRASTTPSTQINYAVGHFGIKPDDVILATIENIWDNNWQATLYISGDRAM